MADLETLRAEFVRQYVGMIQRDPDAYKERVRNEPEKHALQIIEGLNADEIRAHIHLNEMEAEAIKRSRLSFGGSR